MEKEDIKSLDDMAGYFFQVAKEIGHPLKSMSLNLKKNWGEQEKDKYES